MCCAAVRAVHHAIAALCLKCNLGAEQFASAPRLDELSVHTDMEGGRGKQAGRRLLLLADCGLRKDGLLAWLWWCSVPRVQCWGCWSGAVYRLHPSQCRYLHPGAMQLLQHFSFIL